MDRFERLASALRRIPGLEVRENEPMKRHTTFRIGGPARLMALPRSRKEAAAAVRAATEAGIAPFFLGNGSNLLVADHGYEGFVLKACGLDQVREVNRRLRAESGITLARLANAALGRGLTGLEFAHGIPGTLGGAVVMNAGAYGGEMVQVLTAVTYLDGAGEWKIFFHIILPLSKATMAVMVLFYAVAHCSSWFNAMSYLRDKSKFPLQSQWER